ncbi:hypothetical protein ACIGXM_31670 [Kitasatospora sp. NPDC052896]
MNDANAVVNGLVTAGLGFLGFFLGSRARRLLRARRLREADGREEPRCL